MGKALAAHILEEIKIIKPYCGLAGGEGGDLSM